MAWNQPMLRQGRAYVFGLSVATRHLTLNPWSTQVLELFRERLTACDLVAARLAEVA